MPGIVGSLLILAVMIYGLVLMVAGPAKANKLVKWIFQKLWWLTKKILRELGKLLKWGMIRTGRLIGIFGRRHPLATGIIFSLMLIVAILFFFILLSG